MMIVAAVIGAGSTLAGLYLSFYVNVASGAAMVLVCTGFFALTYLFAPQRGIVWASRASRKGV
jgi:ABC-type Mn2+/Zn2+ transport system permease subunit